MVFDGYKTKVGLVGWLVIGVLAALGILPQNIGIDVVNQLFMTLTGYGIYDRVNRK